MGRITAWKAAIQMCLDHPLLGVGAGMFPVSFGTYYRPAEHMPWLTAHSMYFLVLGELALPGIIALLGLTFGNLLANRRVARSLDSVDADSNKRHFPKGPARLLYMLSASMVGFALSGAFLSVAYYPHLFVLSGLMVSARCVAARRAGSRRAGAQRLRRGSVGRGCVHLVSGPNGAATHCGRNKDLSSSPVEARSSAGVSGPGCFRRQARPPGTNGTTGCCRRVRKSAGTGLATARRLP